MMILESNFLDLEKDFFSIEDFDLYLEIQNDIDKLRGILVNVEVLSYEISFLCEETKKILLKEGFYEEKRNNRVIEMPKTRYKPHFARK
ncbi:MAG: hypothetical protein A2086_01155 [Spirochaetes bacterium GWD1_27_9]|nr:MAG: hypothetical protein A2Z98_16085 [Spirochaetes bacterium GWB1_27_13]OHD27974.1 MAG: hypothetical protein A2Y34_11445 [Spirochaetes bacterium GWC1_27_15]OHD33660.1 MAG: hypothetical protein A2086_01155 [Spirochaetes bacterium GWD1_27_9]